MVRNGIGALAIVVAGLLGTGCGGAKTGTVTGKVTVAGKPLTGGTISFVLPTNAELVPVTTEIRDDGTYIAENVPFGTLLISIVPPPGPGSVSAEGALKSKEQMGAMMRDGQTPPAELIAATNPTAPNPAAKSLVPDKYQDPRTSELTVEVKASTTTHNVEI